MASRLEEYLTRVIAADRPLPGAGPAALRNVLSGAAALYDAGLEAYLGAERAGLRRRARLPLPVVSVGNLTVGGTGKTPMTQWLCRRLQETGRRVAVLSRGHGGQGREARVVSDDRGDVFLTAAEAGDEPLLLARSLPGVPVLVGKDRRQSGREAMRRFALDALVLDDGFQYWQLARDLDVVLLDARRPFDNGYPLPRGLLREPKRHLRRAGVVVVTRADVLDGWGGPPRPAPRSKRSLRGQPWGSRSALREEIARLAPRAAVFFARHAAIGLVRLSSSPLPSGGEGPGERATSALSGRPVLAVSAIAQPDSFARTLGDAGMQVVRHVVYDDHHRFCLSDAQDAYRLADELGAEAVVMTEKDAVKWPGVAGRIPVYALRIEMQVEDEARFLAAVTDRLFPGHAA